MQIIQTFNSFHGLFSAWCLFCLARQVVKSVCCGPSQKSIRKRKGFRGTVRATWVQIVNIFYDLSICVWCVFSVRWPFFLLQVKWAKLCSVPSKGSMWPCDPCDPCGPCGPCAPSVIPVVLFVARWANSCPC